VPANNFLKWGGKTPLKGTKKEADWTRIKRTAKVRKKQNSWKKRYSYAKTKNPPVSGSGALDTRIIRTRQ